MNLKDFIRSIPDYPKKGILFRDITTLIKDEKAFSETINQIIERSEKIEFNKIAYPLLFLAFVSRSSEILGKKIFIKMDEKEFILNFNQSIFSNSSKIEVWENASNILITFLENKNSFNEIDWSEMNKFANETFVDESDELKEKSAGAGLTDND